MTETPQQGDTKKCFSCQGVMTYGMSKGSEKYPSKGQWQSADGSAHFGFDQEKQKPFCKANAPNIEKAEKVGASVQSRGEIHLKDINLDQTEIEAISTEVATMLPRQLCRLYFIEYELNKIGLNPTGPFVGMLYNQQMAALRAEAGIE